VTKPKIADHKAGVCECTRCKYCGKGDGLCKFGLRNIGCFMTNVVVFDMSNDFIKAVDKGLNPPEVENGSEQ
jgi:hypothetical protein